MCGDALSQTNDWGQKLTSVLNEVTTETKNRCVKVGTGQKKLPMRDR